MWKTIHASVIGTSHVGFGSECQDESIADVLLDANDEGYLVCLVADGAGSATKGGRGAELACITAMTSIEQSLRTSSLFTTDLVAGWIENIRQAIFSEAEATELTSRDYACTLLGAVIAPNNAVFFQIGDGAIVVSKNKMQGVVFWPDSGPYANMTYFVTDTDALTNLDVIIINTSFDEIAVLSDGLQRLALLFDRQIPHVPFFDPMLSVLRQQPTDQVECLESQLAIFLGSAQVNERTDDDKTLILSTRLS